MCEHTLEEVSKHCTRTSCWMVIHDKVYDVTDFLDEHPGGGEILLEYAGKDATIAFEDNGHTQEARDLAKQYFIGNVADQVSWLSLIVTKKGKHN